MNRLFGIRGRSRGYVPRTRGDEPPSDGHGLNQNYRYCPNFKSHNLGLWKSGGALIWIGVLVLIGLYAAYGLGSNWPRRLETVAYSAAYRTSFAKPCLVDIWGVNCTSVSDTAVDNSKIVELFKRLPQPGSDATVFDYRPKDKERGRIARNENSLVQRFHFVLNFIERRTHCVQRHHCPGFDQFCWRLANIFDRPRKADIPVIQQTRPVGLFHVSNDPWALGVNHYLHGFKGSIGASLSGSNGLPQNASLRSRFCFLLSDGLPSDSQQPKLYAASYRQNRQGRDAREGYAVLTLICCYLACMFGVFFGLTLIGNGQRWVGYAILTLAFAVGLAAAITGASGRLPWQWGQSIQPEQHQTEYRQTFQHDSDNVIHRLSGGAA